VAKVTIVGKATGDWLSTTYHWNCNIAVTEVPPIQVSIQATTTAGDAPLDTHFSSTVTGGKAPYSYYWTFGDGTTSYSANPSHTYGSDGQFTATLVVSDGSNHQASDATGVSVTKKDIVESFAASGPSLLIIMIVVVAAIIVVASIVIVKKRKK
jgi:PKD repeat protein